MNALMLAVIKGYIDIVIYLIENTICPFSLVNIHDTNKVSNIKISNSILYEILINQNKNKINCFVIINYLI